MAKLADKIGLRTLGMSFGVHLFLLLIAAFFGVSQVMDNQVDFCPGGVRRSRRLRRQN